MFSLWMIAVTCLARAAVCASLGTPDLGANTYTTRAECERALMRVARNWRPPGGAYSFRCRRG